MTDVPISVEIESSKAKKGGEQVTRTLDDIYKGAKKTDQETGRLNKSLEETGKTSERVGRRIDRTTGSVTDLSRRLNTATSANRNYNKSLSETDTIARRAAQGIGVFLTAISAREVFSAIDNYTALQNRLKLITKQTGDYAKVSAELSRIAKATGTQIGLNADVFQRLSISAKELGATNTDILKVVQAVQQLGLEGNRSGAALNAGLTQLGQGLGAGILRAEEFNSLIENIPEVANAIAEGLGKTTSQLRNAVLAGEVLSKDVFDAILKQTDTIAERASDIPLTLEREVRNLKTTATELASAFSDSTGALSGLISITKSISENMDTLVNIVGVVAIAFASKLTVSIVSSTAAFVANQIAMVRSTALAARTSAAYLGIGGAATTATVGVTALSRALAFLGGPVGLAITAVAAGVFLLARNQREAITAADLYNEAMGKSKEVLDEVADASKKVSKARIEEAQKATQAAIAQVNADRAIVASALTKAEQLKELEQELLPFTASPFAGDVNFAGAQLRRAEKDVTRLSKKQDDLLKKLKDLQLNLGKLGEETKKYTDENNVLINVNEKAEKAVAAHIKTLKQQLAVLKTSGAEQSKLAALQKAENIALQNKGKLTKAQREEIISLTRALEEQNNAIDQSKFLENLEQELELIGKVGVEREIYKNILEAENIAKRNNVELSEAERQKITEVTEAIAAQQEEMKRAEAQAKLFEKAAGNIQDALADAFSEGKLSMKSFVDLAKRQFAELAAAAVMRVVINPIIAQTAGAVGGGGLGSSVANSLGIPGVGGGGANSLISNIFSGGGLTASLISPETAVSIGAGAADIAEFFGAGLGTQVGIEQGVQSALGAANIGNIAGGFAGNFLADSIFGSNRGIGADIGGALGGLAGTFLIPIPILGTAIGSFLGNAVGGLFGGKPSSKEQFGTIDLSTGELVNRGGLQGKKFSQENFDTVTALSDFAGKFAQQVGGVTENLIVRANNRAGLGVQFGLNGQNNFFGTAEEAMEAIIKGIAERAKDIPEALDTALKNIDFDDAEKALADINFALQFDSLFKETQPKFTELEIAVKGVNEVFDQSLLTVRRLGLDETKLNQAREKALNTLKTTFNQSIQNQILAITNPEAATLTALSEQQAVIRRNAIAVGADIVAVEELFALQRKEIVQQTFEETIQTAQQQLESYKNAIAGIEALQNNLIFNTALSGTNNAGRLQEADRQLQELADRIASGDATALEDLDGTVTQSLEAARDYYGSTAPYLERLTTVDGLLEDAKELAANTFSVDEQILQSALEQQSTQEQLLEETKKQTEALNSQLTATSGDVVSLQNVAESKLLNAGETSAILSEINGVNNLTRDLVRRAKFVASDGRFDFSSSEFGGGATSFAQFVRSQSNGQEILDRFNNIIVGLGGTPQGFATGTGDRTITGMALVGEDGPELVNFGTPAQILSNTQSSNLLNGGNSAEVVETGFARMSRQSSEETVYLGQVLENILVEIQEMNDNIGLGGLKQNAQ